MNAIRNTGLSQEVVFLYFRLKRSLGKLLTVSFVAVALSVAAGCSKAKATSHNASPPEVEVAQVEQKDVPIYTEWVGTLDGMVNADIKSQVTGYLLSKNYTESSFVKKDS